MDVSCNCAQVQWKPGPAVGWLPFGVMFVRFLWPPRIVKTTMWQLFSLEFERSQDTRQNCELECENGGKRDWCEEATVDGNGPVVETLAQDRSPLDREVQHERSDCHQRTSTQLGRSCCQIGVQRDLCARARKITIEREREIWRALGTPLSVSNHACPCSAVLMVQCRTSLVNDASQRDWTSTWQLGKVLRGRVVLSEVHNGTLEVWRKIERENIELERVKTE